MIFRSTTTAVFKPFYFTDNISVSEHTDLKWNCDENIRCFQEVDILIAIVKFVMVICGESMVHWKKTGRDSKSNRKKLMEGEPRGFHKRNSIPKSNIPLDNHIICRMFFLTHVFLYTFELVRASWSASDICHSKRIGEVSGLKIAKERSSCDSEEKI